MHKITHGLLGVLASASIIGQSVAATTAMAMKEYVVDDCHFAFSDPYNGRGDVDNESLVHSASYISSVGGVGMHSIGEVSIRFTCNTKKGRSAFTELGFDKHNGEWKLIPNEYDPKNLAQVKLYPLAGKGTDGAAATDNQTTGDENERTQGLSFCLTDQKQIICGTSSAVGYVAYPKQSSLPKVLELLKSIKFLDPVSP